MNSRKSAKKSAAKVESGPAVVAQPRKSMKKRKRGAEEIIEKTVVSSKKQKIVDGGVTQAVEKKKVKTKTQKNAKKEETSSSEESSSESEEEQKKVVVASKKAAPVVKKPVKESSSDESESSSDEEPKPSKKQSVSTAKHGSIGKPVSKAKLPESSDESESESSDDSDSSDDEEETKVKGAAALKQKPAAVAKDGAVAASKKDESESEDDSSEDEAPKKQPAGAKKGALAPAKKVESSEDSSSEESDSDEEGTNVETVDASAKKAPQTPVTPQATGSNTLEMRNLSFSVNINDVINFFRKAGEVVELRFSVTNDHIAGYGLVEFASHDAAQEALKLNGNTINNRPVKVDFPNKSGVYIRASGGNEMSFQMRGGMGIGRNIFVRGFGADDSVDNVRNRKKAPVTPQATGSNILEMRNLSFSVNINDVINFFRKAGEVVELRFSVTNDHIAGYGLVEFASHDATQEALKLNGNTINNRPVKVDFPNKSGVYIRASGGNEMSFQMRGGMGIGRNIFVRGFGADDSVDNVRNRKKAPVTPQATGSNILEMRNLSFSVNINDVINFFRKAGEVVELRFSVTNDHIAGYGLVEFASHDATQEALKLNGNTINNRPVKVDFPNKSGAYTPASGGNEMSFQMRGGMGIGRNIFVRGFGADESVDNVRNRKKAPVTPQATGSNTLEMRNLSFSVQINDVINFFRKAGEVVELRFSVTNDHIAGHGLVEFASHDAAQEALKLNGNTINNRPVKVDFPNKSGVYIPASGGNEMSFQMRGGMGIGPNIFVRGFGADDSVDNVRNRKKAPVTQATGSKTLFMGNLCCSIEENDVINFFKDAGEVVEVHFAMRDGCFAGYGYVEFATPDAAQEALKFNGELLLGREVTLDFAKGRGAYTPASVGNERSFQKSGGQAQGQTVFVRGFGADDSFDNLRSILEEHFGQCGEISWMSIPKDYESGGPKGIAFIEFADRNAFNKALDLSGTAVGGGTITVKEAKPTGDGAGSGRGGGRGFDGGRSGGRGGRFGGRDGGGFSGGRGGRGRGPNRPSMATPGTGKKTTFSDD